MALTSFRYNFTDHHAHSCTKLVNFSFSATSCHRSIILVFAVLSCPLPVPLLYFLWQSSHPQSSPCVTLPLLSPSPWRAFPKHTSYVKASPSPTISQFASAPFRSIILNPLIIMLAKTDRDSTHVHIQFLPPLEGLFWSPFVVIVFKKDWPSRICCLCIFL